MRFVSSALLLIAVVTARADPSLDAFPPYYLQPWPDKVPAYLELVDREDAANITKALGSVVGLMSELFRQHPEKAQQWLSARPFSRNTQTALVYARWMAGQRDEAKTAARNYGWTEQELSRLEAMMQRTADIMAVTPGNGNDLDMFWGAFFGSGKKAYLDPILFAYNYRARQMKINPGDIAAVARVIGTRDKSGAPEELQKIRARYPDDRTAQALIVAATALWALGSNAQQHDRVRDLVTDYLRSAHDDDATRQLARQIARASIAVITSKPGARVFMLTTRDRDFLKGPVRDMLDRRIAPKVDKVFAPSEPAFLVVLALTEPGEDIEYVAEVIALKGGVSRVPGKIPGKDKHAIGAAMVPLSAQPPGTTGLVELVITVAGSATPRQSFRTMVYFEGS